MVYYCLYWDSPGAWHWRCFNTSSDVLQLILELPSAWSILHVKKISQKDNLACMKY